MKFYSICNILLLILLSLNISKVCAYDIKDYRFPYDPSGKSILTSRLQLGLSLNYGNMKSTDNSLVKERSLMGVGLEGSIGFAVSIISFSYGMEFSRNNQVTDISEVGNTNASGSQKLSFASVGVKLSKVEILYKYYLDTKYSFSEKNNDGNLVTLENPSKSFSAQILYNYYKFYYLGLGVSSITYKTYNNSDISVELTNDQEMTFKSYLLSFGFLY